MKKPILILVALFAITLLPVRAGTIPIIKAVVTGTVQTQVLTSPVTGKIHTEKLDSKRIFEEFGVSKTDYELVIDLDNGGILELIGKHSGANLPTIKIVTFGTGSAQILDTKIRAIKLVSTLGTSTATNLFKSLAGELSGTAHYVGDLSNGAFVDKFTYSVTASGTDTSNNGSAILKFKVVGKGIFTQAP